ncbi:unnamed protein product [Nezara viridula]|uniref:Uncharacterized protein n=1 Tax=Nezara viridula TaxID=85310 RepID=A0A9P0MLP7_NEZVI|nr:unnamed protein product [Nezara viridula]
MQEIEPTRSSATLTCVGTFAVTSMKPLSPEGKGVQACGGKQKGGTRLRDQEKDKAHPEKSVKQVLVKHSVT